MNKPFIYFVSLSLVMGGVMCVLLFIIEPEFTPLAKRGVMDLRDYDFISNGFVELSGEWAFYWDQTVSVETYDSVIAQAPNLYTFVPSYWDKLSRIDDRIKPQGVAIYSLTILKNFEDEIDTFAIRTHNITPNAEIYIDGEKIYEIGNVDSNHEKSVPANKSLLVPVEASGDTLAIVISISNYHNNNGGLNRPIYFGLHEDLSSVRERKLAIDSIFLGGLLLITLYQFSVVILSRKRIAPLYLGLICALSFIFAGLKGEMALLTIFPGWDGEIRCKIIFFALSQIGPIFALYCFSLHPDYSYSKISRIVLPTALVMAVLVVSTPMRICFQFMLPLQIIMVAFILYTVFILIRALYKTKDRLIMFSLFGMEFLVLSIILSLVDNRVQTVFQSIAGAFFVFGVYQTVLEAKIFSNALTQIDKLSTEREKLEKQNIDFFTRVLFDRGTGMYNKVLLDNFLESKWTADKLKHKHSMSMILMDVDHFKFYKNVYGHKQSEVVMTHLGQIVSQGVVNMDIFMSARYGEDAFAVITEDVDEFTLYRSADKFRTMVESKGIKHRKSIEHSFAGDSNILTISVGCATIIPSRDNDPETLIDRATRALILAKKNGRNRTEIVKS